ncbi:type II toxin-antitoxin system PemK/MazF family toxin [Arthrobacter cheniae]|uniref:Type II toxin-antitoxin system PemK/MazF family toxin n=1 Tax=Arthrobacter cheniae TaxID=1258888 RepID=A0A3A5M6P8_9MICC|nr:type II toxin-antitoxin system PemK/MazF family toxin [Arthrobacter cheniae]RJT81877.1 type II toxin-antitoxin system PemK/MazF family toxin [Arthrobacter cheniae]
MAITLRSVLSLAGRVVRAVSSTSAPPADRQPAGRRPATGRASSPSPQQPASRRQKAVIAYSPSADGNPDPGEIVWTWVPYEDDPTQGKDRPVLLIGTSGKTLLGLMLTSRDRNNSRSHDDRYIDIGTGAWDRQGRPSEVRTDRVLRLALADIRREGAVLPRGQFEQVIAAVPDDLLG